MHSLAKLNPLHAGNALHERLNSRIIRALMGPIDDERRDRNILYDPSRRPILNTPREVELTRAIPKP